ncbi:hypothetical protein TB2_000297 [Malus domestica]
MATAIDLYSSSTMTPDLSDLLREDQLMKALMPFMKSASSTSPSTSYTYPPQNNQNFNLYPDFCSAPIISQAGVIGLNQLSPSQILEIQSQMKPLHSSVDAKLQEICQSLAANSTKQGNTGEPCSVPETKPMVSAPLETRMDDSFKTELKSEWEAFSSLSSSPSRSDRSDESSTPETDITFLDFSDSQWDEAENFGLEKYPSVEIDFLHLQRMCSLLGMFIGL